MIKIGIIGSEDTVMRMMTLKEEFSGQAVLLPFSYKNKDEMIEKSCDAGLSSDVLLYSGEAPYKATYSKDKLKKPALYIPRLGTSFYRTLWQIREDGIPMRRISSEVLPEFEIRETMGELGLQVDKIYIRKIDFANGFSYEDIAKYHWELFSEGKTDVIITGLTKVHKILNERGVPAYKVYPTKHLIREYIKKAIILGKVDEMKKTQTAVQIIKMKITGEKDYNSSNFEEIKENLEKQLMIYTRQHLGSLFPSENDEYLIFTHRGAMEQMVEIFDFNENWNFKKYPGILFHSGIGYGSNVNEAEYNAKVAMKHALKYDFSCIFYMDESGSVTGPLGQNKKPLLTYTVSAGEDEKIRMIAEDTSLSPAYISKIQHLIVTIGRQELDAKVVSEYLGISDRSARRILKVLVDSGYGDMIYTASKAKTGRPRKIYKIKL